MVTLVCIAHQGIRLERGTLGDPASLLGLSGSRAAFGPPGVADDVLKAEPGGGALHPPLVAVGAVARQAQA